MSFFKKIIVSASIVLIFSTTAFAQTMPAVKAADLNEKAISWPQGLTAKPTILMFAFQRNQQDNIDGWVSGLKLKAANAPSWFEVPLINNPGALGRWFIDNGMRSGIKESTDRARVVTVYTKKADFMKSMGIPNESDVHLLVVDRSGKVITRVSGDYSSDGAAKIRAALN